VINRSEAALLRSSPRAREQRDCATTRVSGGGSGAAGGLNAAVLNADASQQTLLTSPHHE
jgi:hypothetical protein